jgi:adenosylhomocysteinase
MPTLEDLAFDAERDIGATKTFFPILALLGDRWAAARPWTGRTLGLNLHLTPLTASLVQELQLGGAQVAISAANPGTTDPGTVELLRQAGAHVYTGGDLEDRHKQVLTHQPHIIADVGADLLRLALDRRDLAPHVLAGVAMTLGGVHKLRERSRLAFPVVNLSEGRLRDAVENRYGLGEAVWEAVMRLTGMHLAGRRVAVVGYGAVGRGIASWGRSAGLAVEIVETDPVRRLFAHYDGYPTPTLADALSRVHLVVTATGSPRAIPAELLESARDRLVLLNAGTGGDEIDVSGIQRLAERVDHVASGVISYRMESGNHLIVLGDGHPLNIVVHAGSPEPVLLHFGLLGLVLEWLVGQRLPAGEHAVPADIEETAARLALQALAIPGM